jgi:cell division protein FtsI/penicillin-binding protein 2
MELPPLHKKAKILLFFLFLWAVLVTAHLFYYSIWAKEYYIERGRKLSEKSGIIPARRGMITDKDKHPLAWNERYYDLYLSPYSGFPSRQKRIFRALKKIIPEIKYQENKSEICLQKNITPIIQSQCAELIRHFPEIELHSKVIRVYANYPELQRYVGKTENRDGILRGISGLEMQYNKLLKGKNGYFTVMADRLGRWIPGTWKEKQQATAGEDLILKKSLTELRSSLRY